MPQSIPAAPSASPLVGTPTTFRDYAARWPAWISGEIALSTRHEYVSVLERDLVPILGDLELEQITRGVVRQTLDILAERGQGAATITKARAILSSILGHAVERERLTANPVREVRRPRPLRRRALIVPNEEQLAHVLTAVRAGVNAERQMLYEILAGAGLRPGEAQALRPHDLCTRTQRLRVAATVIRAPKRLRGDKVVDGPKAKTRPERWVELADSLFEGLRPFVAIRAQADWLFPGRFGKPINYTTVRNDMRVVTRAASIPGMTAHCFRHARASIWISSGADLEWVRRQLGHSNISVTVMMYGQHLPMREQAVLRDLPAVRPLGPV